MFGPARESRDTRQAGRAEGTKKTNKEAAEQNMRRQDLLQKRTADPLTSIFPPSASSPDKTIPGDAAVVVVVVVVLLGGGGAKDGGSYSRAMETAPGLPCTSCAS